MCLFFLFSLYLSLSLPRPSCLSTSKIVTPLIYIYDLYSPRQPYQHVSNAITLPANSSFPIACPVLFSAHTRGYALSCTMALDRSPQECARSGVHPVGGTACGDGKELKAMLMLSCYRRMKTRRFKQTSPLRIIKRAGPGRKNPKLKLY